MEVRIRDIGLSGCIVGDVRSYMREDAKQDILDVRDAKAGTSSHTIGGDATAQQFEGYSVVVAGWVQTGTRPSFKASDPYNLIICHINQFSRYPNPQRTAFDTAWHLHDRGIHGGELEVQS